MRRLKHLLSIFWESQCQYNNGRWQDYPKIKIQLKMVLSLKKAEGGL